MGLDDLVRGSCTLMRLPCGYAGRAALFQRNMIHVRRCDGYVFARSHAGKHSEIVDEVRLVVVAAPVRQVGPVLLRLLGLGAQGAQNLLKTPHTLEGFRRQPGLIAEELNEAARAESDVAGEVADAQAVRGLSKPSSGESDGWV